ncbi:exodeoxyribonuclease III [Flavonifractor sp. An135]|nr:exodeoxyribonuclease III [Flavonifractor sp. An135]OUQ22458.1 exodeoxyribonuclease III [Flavonifractor sp. An135]
MKLISWNVNGLRACLNKGFLDFFQREAPDVLCLQETKLQPHQIELDLPGYHQYWNSAEKKGYSGTAVFTKTEPLAITYGIGIPEHDTEGRVITAEYEDFYLVCCYTPNAQRGLTRLDYRMVWEDAFRAYLKELDGKKPVILCGDLNVAHQEIDLKNFKTNRGNAGFTDEERGKMTELLDAGFVDSFRSLYPDVTGAYSWWSYMYHARENNAGWRIDYFICSQRLKDRIADSKILADVMGSDHCPVELDLREEA